MNNPSFIVETDKHGVTTLTLNRPEVHNAFDDTLIEKLTKELEAIGRNPNIRVLLLAARGKSFSAGADLNWMQRMANYSFEKNHNDALSLAHLLQTLNALNKPTIALVQGAALGGGVGLVACCDIAIAADSAVFCLSEVKLGLTPAVISPYVIAAMGARAARRYFLTAERFTALEAHRLGLIHCLANTQDLRSAAQDIIDNLLHNAPMAIAETKKLIADVQHHSIDEKLIFDTAKRIAKIRVSAEGQEGLAAFLEKRPPRWIKG